MRQPPIPRTPKILQVYHTTSSKNLYANLKSAFRRFILQKTRVRNRFLFHLRNPPRKTISMIVPLFFLEISGPIR